MEEKETDEELIKRHRKEKKDLQAKIQCMKNAIPKNDKKRRKQLVEDIAKLEAELDQKQEEELKQWRNNVEGGEKVESAANGIGNLVLKSEEQDDIKDSQVSKAQKRRDKKAALEKERESRIAEAEIENLSGSRHLESLKLSQMLADRQLQIKQIPSDGHCMYRAVEDQLTDRDCSLSLSELRAQASEYMRSHADDFLPFLTNLSTGDMYTPDEFEKYCSDVAETAAWGGQLELRALTHVLKMPIEVIQAESPTIVIGEEYGNTPVRLIYMRYAYGLGEHYNSVEPLSEAAAEEES
ncbi:deubiquitinase OTUD6B-like [Acipenser oxyrinchus oxyrinchus]|uniref:ubiquitinyl hydrolase 1 n=1 Tax=Acipenser oxyrinchus oxyrinchus TaxID=40147 RepID=A0AAD8LRE5_ACIOX|nr:deubiquitinase OTUD6B-like [Acipenser oxyrinchus oxyrinchus]